MCSHQWKKIWWCRSNSSPLGPTLSRLATPLHPGRTTPGPRWRGRLRTAATSGSSTSLATSRPWTTARRYSRGLSSGMKFCPRTSRYFNNHKHQYLLFYFQILYTTTGYGTIFCVINRCERGEESHYNKYIV